MKRTPTNISKNKQVIRVQIESYRNRLKDLRSYKSITSEEKLAKAKEIRYAEDQIFLLIRVMNDLVAQSRAGYLWFRK